MDCHPQVTYYEVHREEVDQAMEHHKKGQRSLSHVPSRVENKEAFNILMVRSLCCHPRKEENHGVPALADAGNWGSRVTWPAKARAHAAAAEQSCEGPLPGARAACCV